MATNQHPALRKAAANKPATASSKPRPQKQEEPLEDLSHLSPMEQLIEAFKGVPANKIKVWPVRK